jgi:ribosomal protein L30E
MKVVGCHQVGAVAAVGAPAVVSQYHLEMHLDMGQVLGHKHLLVEVLVWDSIDLTVMEEDMGQVWGHKHLLVEVQVRDSIDLTVVEEDMGQVWGHKHQVMEVAHLGQVIVIQNFLVREYQAQQLRRIYHKHRLSRHLENCFETHFLPHLLLVGFYLYLNHHKNNLQESLVSVEFFREDCVDGKYLLSMLQ